MRISLQWLADYVELPPAEALARRLTAAGLEVEAIERPGDALSGVLVAQVRESVPHPQADKLSVTQVDIGGRALLQVVCGAKNYRVGDKVALATAGSRLPNGMEIRNATLRGVESFGMLCSARELGLSEEASGLLILPAEASLGTPLAQALGLDDALFEVNVTPNRPDALSHLGIAREVAVLTGGPLREPPAAPKEGGPPVEARVQVRIEDAERCPRYAARVVEGVRIGPSPAWMQRRLEACGVRAINNVVDVTNYVLLEYGQPLHAFDLDRVAGPEIIVRRARAGERMTTLDGKERTLDADDLLICDRKGPSALAGVMGGGDSEVHPGTTRVLLESANFQPAGVRRTARRHGLHTEASHRFERGADVDAVPLALDRAAALIAELGGGTAAPGRLDVYPAPAPARQVRLRAGRVSALLGAEVPGGEVERILGALGFRALERGAEATRYEVPRRRVDVEREEDLVEEVARVYGFERIPARLPRGVAELAPEPAAAQAQRRAREALAGDGFDEVVNYSFVAPSTLAVLDGEKQPIALVNPLSGEQSVMRTTLLGGLLENLSRSVRHQVEGVRLYEMGRVYLKDAGGGQGLHPAAREVHRLAGVLWGLRGGVRSWTAREAREDFYDARGALESVLGALRVEGATFRPAEARAYHPRACAELVLADGTLAGRVGELHPRAARSLGLPAGVLAFEVDTAPLYAAATLVPTYRPLPRFPTVLRDLAVVVPLELPNEEVRRVILEVGAPLVEDALVFDVYTGKPIPEGRKNVAYAIRYRSAERTLTDSEVTQAHQQIITEVNRRLGGALRA